MTRILPSDLVTDSTGQYVFSPNSCAHVYTYAASGNIDTDTATDTATGNAFKQTYTYTNGNMTASSAWLKQ